MIEENSIEVEEPAKVEVHQEQRLEKEPEHDEFHTERIDFMPVGSTLEGGRIIDPRFSPLPEGPLGIPTLPSPTPAEELEARQILLQMEGVLEMPPPSVEEELVLAVPPIAEDLTEEQEHQVAPEVHPAEEQIVTPMSETIVNTQAPVVEPS